MILRRVIQHVRKQEWTAIAIDFLIVVIGVFVGLQVSNWNDSRKTSQRAAVFSERLAKDMRYEAWAYEYLIDYNRDVLSGAKAALDALYGTVPLSDEQFLIDAYRATQYKYMDRGRSTFDELISTGNIGLIADEDLRTTAISIYTTTLIDVVAEEGRLAPVRTIFRRRVPADVQHALLEKCGDLFAASGDYQAIVGSLAYPCTLELDASQIAAAATLLRTDPGLVESLQIRFADLVTAIQDLEKVNGEIFIKLRTIAGRKP
jgi:hypothetical protein